MILWNDDLSVGNTVLDAEHRQLIELINNLQKDLSSRDRTTVLILDQSLKFLVDYAEGHLKHEEELMRTAGYPKYMEHKHKHDEFRETSAAFLNEAASSPGEDAHEEQIRELLFFLQRWLVSHIKGSDREYIPYLSG